MVYINSRGEVVDDTRQTPTNIFWKVITFFVLFFKTLVGIEDRQNKKNDDIGGSGPVSSNFFSGGGGGGSGGSQGKRPDNSSGRKFGPRGFKSITDLPPPPSPCSGGACGM